MFVLPNVIIESSNVRKNKGTTDVNKSTVTYDVGSAQCEDGSIKYEKEKRDPPNVTKI